MIRLTKDGGEDSQRGDMVEDGACGDGRGFHRGKIWQTVNDIVRSNVIKTVLSGARGLSTSDSLSR